MKLKIISSSSSGNGYAIVGDNESLLIEAGVPFFSAEKAVHFKLKDCVGCLVSHEHGDHAGYIEEYAKYIPIYASAGTLRECGLSDNPNSNTLTPLKKAYQIGRFRVLAFPTQHDASEPIGFLIEHPDIGSLLFATDTYYLKYRFDKLSFVMIECNYDKGLLKQNVDTLEVHPKVAERVKRSHMSLDNCIKTLQVFDLSSVNCIVLLHLSRENSNSQKFRYEIAKATGKRVVVAEKGLEIDLWKS